MTPEQIASGLTTHECEWLTGWGGVRGAAFNAVAGALHHKHLIDRSWQLTQLGLAVRKVLEEQDD